MQPARKNLAHWDLIRSFSNGDEAEMDDDRVEVEDCWAYVETEEKQEINDVWPLGSFHWMSSKTGWLRH